MKRRYYLAYGSNMNIHQMLRRCPMAKVVGSVMLEGYELLVRGGDGSAVATIEPKVGSSVPCALWLIAQSDEAALDVYEGFPCFYRKEMVTVQFGRRKMRVMAYVMNGGHELGKPSAYYFRTIHEGYRDFDLNTSPLYAAFQVSAAAAISGSNRPD
jgi:hypothetical protein